MTRAKKHPLLTDESWLRTEYAAEGRSPADIALELGVTGRTVLNALVRAKIPRRRPGHPAGPLAAPRGRVDPRLDDAKWLQTQYARRKRSTADIAQEIGVSRRTVQTALAAAGVPRCSSRAPLSAADHALIRQLYVEQHLSMRDIGKQLGLSEATIRRRLRSLGVETRPRGWR